MSGFSEQSLEKKLGELNASQQSIQQLSLWLIHHRRHFQAVVKTWFKELCKAHRDRKLTFLYLANDVCQNSKKKNPEISKEFGVAMKKVMEHLSVVHLDEKTVKAVARLLKIWKDRCLYDVKIQTDLDRIWATKSLEIKPTDSEASESTKTTSPEAKRAKKESPNKKKVRVTYDRSSPTTPPLELKSLPDDPAALIADATAGSASSDLLHALLSPSRRSNGSSGDGDQDGDRENDGPPADPPDPEELMKALQDLESAASSDGEVRDKISKFPTEVSEVGQLERLKSSEEGKNLLLKVEEASKILDEYNERLQQELKDRKKVTKMIKDFLAAQKDLEAQAEERIEQYRDKLDKVNSVRDDLKSHIQSLPDLTKLPDVTTGGLAPLPSAGDLFTIK